MAARAFALALCAMFLAAIALSQDVPVPQRIREMLNARNYSGAERAIAEELRRLPEWSTGHLLIAQIYARTGRYELAERSASAAIRQRESLDGLMLLAVATMRLGRLNDSISWLEQAARRHPDHAEIYKILGLDYALGGVLRESEKAFAKAVALQPGDWEGHYYQGRTLFELRRFREAHDALQRAVDLNRASVKGWTALGQTQERLGKVEAAETSYKQALSACENGRECAWPLLQLGFLYRTRNAPEQALALFRRAVEARPDWARPHFHLGKELAEIGDLRAARKELEEAVKLDESRSEYHYQLGLVYRWLGEAEKASAQLARFRALADLKSHVEVPDFAQP